MVYRLVSQILSRQLTRCLLCHGRAENAGLCAACRDELPTLVQACQRCALPLPPAAATCARCLQRPPAFTCARAAWHYAFPVAQLLQRFKYQRDLAAGRTLAQLAAVQLAPLLAAQESRPDLLLPVPLHWRRYWQRGFNQAQLIAAEFGRQWELPVHPGLLRKRSASAAQQQLGRAQRLRNLQQSFFLRRPLPGLHVGLVDDVITTGATLEAASRTLLDAGASRVSAFALARTP